MTRSNSPRALIQRLLVLFFVNFFPMSNIFSQSSIWTTGGFYEDTTYINSLAMAEADPEIIYAGTEHGVFKTVDGGHTWTKTALTNTLVRVVQVAPDNPDIVYAGTDHGGPPVPLEDGIYKSEDGGSTWTPKALPGARVNAIAINPLNPNILYAGTGKPLWSYSGEIVGIFKSTDGGDTWQEKLSEEQLWDLDAVAALLIDADDSSCIYAATYGGLRKSTDGGENWVSRQIQDLDRDMVVALAMTPAGFNLPVVYAVNWGEDVYKSQDRGDSWTATNTPHIDANSPWALAVDPNNPNVIYVGTNDYRFGSNEHLYKSTDGANTWSLKDNGLPTARSSSPSSIVIDPRNSDVYVSLHDGGVYKSTDGAESWNILSTIIVSVEEVGGGIPERFVLAQNYPNPFNPVTTIKFSTPHSAYVTLKVSNTLGEEVTTLVSENLSAGIYKVEWNARGFSSGVYFYRLQAREFTETKKLLLLR